MKSTCAKASWQVIIKIKARANVQKDLINFQSGYDAFVMTEPTITRN